MASVLLLVFILQVVIHLVNTFGAQSVNDLLWLIYCRLPTPQAQDASSLAKLRGEVVRLNREMNATSAQDDFANWARLRRQHDKAKDAHDNKSRDIQSFRTTFDRTISTVRWLSTQGLQFFANFYFSKQAMFWLPQGWVPYHIEWLLSFPRAPLGSISINVWALACASVISMVAEGIRAAWALKEGKVADGARKKERPIAAVGGSEQEKKEL